ncbi:MAG: 5'-nucleotidase C-terminal domain-containing protein [Candidatus Edwardsbacteria bacterium]|jgi:2',3'-cyclic-nucleotide 2'-phosphodiesterase (5'-nucleotidase family)|nr:5'-nucleotidase C-terminal domain-containing protein [Candidatus Edwardsbacteria bacterium]
MRRSILIAGAVLALATAAPADQWQHLVIMHTNDIHGHLPAEEAWWINPNFPPPLTNGAGAALLIKEEREKAQRAGHGFLLLEGGDIFSGTPVGEVSKGRAVLEFMNALGYDAMAVGNHDFDQGQQTFLSLLQDAKFPALGANVVDSATQAVWPHLKPYIVVERLGLRIGILGLSSQYTRGMSTAANIKGLDFLTEIPAGRRWMDSVRAQRVDLVIGLLHTGNRHDRRIADSIPGFDVIIGAHSHTGMREAYEDPANHTIIVQTYGNLSCIGKLDLAIDPATRQIVGYEYKLKDLLAEEVDVDTTFQRLIGAWQAKAEAGFDSVIGVARNDIGIVDGESPIGNLVCDAMREAVGADFAFQNSAGIRGTLPAGDITYRAVHKVDAFGNYIVTYNMTGAQVVKICETSVLGFHGIFQVGGLSMTYDARRPIWQKVSQVLVNGQPIDTMKIYKVATNNFLAGGGQNYKEFNKGADRNDTYLTVRQALADYVRRHTPLEVHIEGRIRETSGKGGGRQ